MTSLTRIHNLAWRKFLASEAGRDGMLFLRERVPSVSKGDADGIIFDAGKAQGYRDCLDKISEVIGFVEEKEESIENP